MSRLHDIAVKFIFTKKYEVLSALSFKARGKPRDDTEVTDTRATCATRARHLAYVILLLTVAR